ncbi:MAG: spondin domain-containing protein [Methylococcales bacterium]|nr:spondin domain-containing protein [Methylococcales bacterium]
MKKIICTLSVFVCLYSPLSFSEVSYQVKITNITRGQTFTPILAASHRAGIKAFALGQPAIPELVAIAESGNTAPAISTLSSFSAVQEVKDSGGVLAPGKSVIMILAGGDNISHITIVSMLIPTNDTFFSVNGKALPMGSDPVTYHSIAYDAGSEENDELCASIPGPPSVCSGEGSSDAGGEGYVHVQAGIHGTGDLSAAQYDWRYAVAEITIQRMETK